MQNAALLYYVHEESVGREACHCVCAWLEGALDDGVSCVLKVRQSVAHLFALMNFSALHPSIIASTRARSYTTALDCNVLTSASTFSA